VTTPSIALVESRRRDVEDESEDGQRRPKTQKADDLNDETPPRSIEHWPTLTRRVGSK
jgi:hypothetical protein